MAAASSSDMLGGTMTQSPGWDRGNRVRRIPGLWWGGGRWTGTYLPVGWGGHSLGGRELERVHRSQDLVKVASGGGGVEQRQLQPLVGTDDEHLNAAEEEGRGYARLSQVWTS